MMSSNPDAEETPVEESAPSPRYNFRLSRRSSATSDLDAPKSTSLIPRYPTELDFNATPALPV